MKRKLVITAAAVLFAATGALADVNSSAGIIFPELTNGAGARAAAMGGAFTAVADDASAAYWNPAGLGTIRRASIELTYDRWFMDSFYQHLLAAVPLAAGALGADIFYMNFGTFDRVDIYGQANGSAMNPYTMAGTLSYGMNFGPMFSAGISGKFISSSIGGLSSTGYAADAGVLFTAGIFSAGLTGRNLGSGGAFSLPADIRLGLALNAVKTQSHNLLIAADTGYILKDALNVNAGIEYTFAKTLSIRAGYKFSTGQNNIEGLTGVSAGAGLNLGQFGFDYAFVPYGNLGTAQRADIRYEFGGGPAKPEEKTAAAAPTPGEKQQARGFSKTEEELYNMFFAAGSLENSGKLAEAEAKYKEILKADSTYSQAWKRLGAVFVKEKNKAGAIKCFEAYLKLKPDDDAVQKWLKNHK
jgi:hypothetical protein